MSASYCEKVMVNTVYICTAVSSRCKPRQSTWMPGRPSRLRPKSHQIFSKTREINILSGARFFLFSFRGVWDVIREQAPNAKDFTNKKDNRFHPLTEEERAKNRTKSRVRAKGGHPFLMLKRTL